MQTYQGGPWQQQYPQQQAYVQSPSRPSRVHPGVLLGVTAWRLLIIAFALIGFFAALEDLGNPWPGLSLQASLFTAIVYGVLVLWPLFTLGRSHEPSSSWLRGGTAVLLLLVMIVYMTFMEGDVDETWSLFEHVLTPLIVTIDWIAVGKGASRVKWWHPLTWITIPLAYLVYYIADDLNMYGGMLRPDDDEFAMMASGLLGLTVVLGFVLYGIGKLRKAASSGQQSPPPQQPVHPQAYGAQQQMPQGRQHFQQPSGPHVQPGQPQPQQPVPYGPGPQSGPPR